MEYFILDVHELYTPPRINGLINNMVKCEVYTPNHVMLPIVEHPLTVFTDIIMHPCFMVSKEVKKVIQLYEPHCRFDRLILFDGKRKQNKLYFAPRLEAREAPIEMNHRLPALLKVISGEKVQVIARLDFVESLLRRNVVGIGLKELESSL